jgi:hypothetical protein
MSEQTIGDLPVGTKFKLCGEAYELLEKRASARVQQLRPKHVRLPNGVEFDRRDKPFYVSLGAVVEEVLD